MKSSFVIASVMVLASTVWAQNGEVDARKRLDDAGEKSSVTLTQCRADLASWLDQDKQSTKTGKVFWFDRLSTEELKRKSREAKQCGFDAKDRELSHTFLLFSFSFEDALLERAEYIIKQHSLTGEYLLE